MPALIQNVFRWSQHPDSPPKGKSNTVLRSFDPPTKRLSKRTSPKSRDKEMRETEEAKFATTRPKLEMRKTVSIIGNPMPENTKSYEGIPNIQIDLHEAHEAQNELNHALDTQNEVVLDGSSLTLFDLVAAARAGAKIAISERPEFVNKLNESVTLLHRKLEGGHHVYGVNTGCGGSADVRTNHLYTLQQGFIQHHLGGVLTPADLEPSTADNRNGGNRSHSLPREVVKAGMIVRCNSLLRGHSAVRLEVIRMLVTFVNEDMVPIVPLRGSISASGDLSPLAYIAGTLGGHPGIYIQCGQKRSFEVMSADKALQTLGLNPLSLGPKESLGLMNGTAISAAAATLAFHGAESLATLAQILTAMATEGLHGTRENYHPFIAQVRPHKGQIESAQRMYDALEGSQLIRDYGKTLGHGLAQDRYALRTASQWIGPQLEDLSLAREQLSTELNSTTDNPLVDVDNDKFHHGGNFQAMAVTSAMEKTRLAVQHLGKLLFAQTSEMIDASMNGVLPPNLAFDDPSVSFAFKGIDINMAAYMSELAYLANPVSTHVQSAELNNQSINSLALISARYTQDAVDLLSIMAAAHLYTVCQAIDLQVLFVKFTEETETIFMEQGKRYFPATAPDASRKLFDHFLEKWTQLKSSDLTDRCVGSVQHAVSAFISAWIMEGGDTSIVPVLKTWSTAVQPMIKQTFERLREQIIVSQGSIAREYLGRGTRRLFEFVRIDLGVPALRGLADHPCYRSASGEAQIDQGKNTSIGGQLSKIYMSIKDGRLGEVLLREDGLDRSFA